MCLNRFVQILPKKIVKLYQNKNVPVFQQLSAEVCLDKFQDRSVRVSRFKNVQVHQGSNVDQAQGKNVSRSQDKSAPQPQDKSAGVFSLNSVRLFQEKLPDRSARIFPPRNVFLSLMSSAGINPSSSASVFLSRSALLSQGESAGVFQGRNVRGCQDKSAKRLNLLMENNISEDVCKATSNTIWSLKLAYVTCCNPLCHGSLSILFNNKWLN